MHHLFLTILSLLLCAAPLCAAEATLYTLNLTNQSGEGITSISFTPLDPKLQPAGPVREARQLLPAGGTGAFPRPAAALLRVVVSTEKSMFTFPVISFHEQKDTVATLSMKPRATPELQFFDGTTARAAFCGNNSLWGLRQPLLAGFPYSPGETTLAQTKALGEIVLGKGLNELVGTLVLEQETWSLSLIFDGKFSNSRMVSARMLLRPSPRTDMDAAIERSVESQGYVPFVYGTSMGRVDVAALAVAENMQPGQALMDKVLAAQKAQLKDEIPEARVIWRVPAALFETMVAAVKRGERAESVLRKAGNTVLVQTIYDDKTPLSVILLTTAASLPNTR